MSEENKFWKFLSKDKFLNKERTDLDKRLLKNFYLNKGYYNVVIEQAFTKILDNKQYLHFKFVESVRYTNYCLS